jgi:hypothetical protein
MPWFVFAQATTADPLSGGAGWAGAGLLSLVLGWLLLIYLPRQEQQMDKKESMLLEELSKKDKEFTTALSEQNRSKEVILATITSHCKEELSHITERFMNELRSLLRGKE